MEENLEREVENKRKKFLYSLYRNEMLLNFVINFVKCKKKRGKRFQRKSLCKF